MSPKAAKAKTTNSLKYETECRSSWLYMNNGVRDFVEPASQHGPSSYFKHTIKKIYSWSRRACSFFPRVHSLEIYIRRYVTKSTYLASSKRQVDLFLIRCVSRTSWGISLIGYFCEWIHQFMANDASLFWLSFLFPESLSISISP